MPLLIVNRLNHGIDITKTVRIGLIGALGIVGCTLAALWCTPHRSRKRNFASVDSKPCVRTFSRSVSIKEIARSANLLILAVDLGAGAGTCRHANDVGLTTVAGLGILALLRRDCITAKYLDYVYFAALGNILGYSERLSATFVSMEA